METAYTFQMERDEMVRSQIEQRGIKNPRLLEAMRTLPRHLFVLKEDEIFAYRDEPIPIGFKQTISQPYITALMTSLAGLEGEETVLEVGTGSGYQAALLAMLAKKSCQHRAHTGTGRTCPQCNSKTWYHQCGNTHRRRQPRLPARGSLPGNTGDGVSPVCSTGTVESVI